MNINFSTYALFAVVGSSVMLSVLAAPTINVSNGEKHMTNKSKVVELLKSIETGASGPVAYINPDKYIQHNLAVGDGLEGFGKVLQALPKDSARVDTLRAFQDGDYVFAHSEFDFFGPKIGFDIFRFEDGKIVEHWDNLQETPKAKNPSGHSMIDGPTSITDLNSTEANKAMVKEFVEEILVKGNMAKLTTFFNGDNYIQHNPMIGDQLTGLGKALAELAQRGVSMKYNQIHHVLGEGNFVLVASEGVLGGDHTAFYDLFRVQDGKIAEHWDTIQAIPPKSEWKNPNGKF